MDSENVRQAFEDEIIANEEATQRHHRDAARMQSLETRLSIAETALFKQNDVIDKVGVSISWLARTFRVYRLTQSEF